MTTPEQSRKNDRRDHKLRWELLPLPLLEYVVKVYTYGAEKYAPNSWQNLTDGYERYKAALFRHIVAYEKGETTDPESHLPHLAHAAWNAIALLYFGMKEADGNAQFLPTEPPVTEGKGLFTILKKDGTVIHTSEFPNDFVDDATVIVDSEGHIFLPPEQAQELCAKYGNPYDHDQVAIDTSRIKEPKPATNEERERRR